MSGNMSGFLRLVGAVQITVLLITSSHIVKYFANQAEIPGNSVTTALGIPITLMLIGLSFFVVWCIVEGLKQLDEK